VRTIPCHCERSEAISVTFCADAVTGIASSLRSSQ
jgi:hypothetical protein